MGPEMSYPNVFAQLLIAHFLILSQPLAYFLILSDTFLQLRTQTFLDGVLDTEIMIFFFSLLANTAVFFT